MVKIESRKVSSIYTILKDMLVFKKKTEFTIGTVLKNVSKKKRFKI